MGVERVEQVSDPVRWRDRGDPDDRSVAGSERAQGRCEVPPGAPCDVAEVLLGHDKHVRNLHDPCLQELEDVARPRLDHHGRRVTQLGHIGLGLAHADGLDDHHVVRWGQDLGGLARRRRQAAKPRAGGCRANQDAFVARVVLDPRAVPEQGAARAARRRVDGQDGHAPAAPAPLREHRRQQ